MRRNRIARMETVSVIIPAFNEEKRVGNTLEHLVRFFSEEGLRTEIIVVDDGSTDDTARTVQGYAERFPQVRLMSSPGNEGKGAALKRGVLASSGDVVLLSDADLSTPIEEFSKLLVPLRNGLCDIAIGSRGLPESKIVVRQPWWREAMGKTFNWFVRWWVLPGFRDTQCGFKLFLGLPARELFQELAVSRFACDVEILARARGRGLRVREIPVRWIDSPDSRVNPVVDSFRMLKDLGRIRRTVGKRKEGVP